MSRWQFTILVLVAVISDGCHRRKIPASPHPPPSLGQTGLGEGWPPQTVGVTNLRTLPTVEAVGSLTEEYEARIRRSAEADTSVRALLGDRFAYLATRESEVEKGKGPPRGENLQTVVEFYNHASNMLIEVRMRGTVVLGADARRPLQTPPAGQDEIALAIQIARSDQRIAGLASGLRADAIEIDSESAGDRDSRHRVLQVTFSREEGGAARYSATVDLTDRRVLRAGAVARQ